MASRKSIRILTICICLIVSVLLAVFLLRAIFIKLSVRQTGILNGGVPFCNSPLDKYDFKDCKIRLLGYYHGGVFSLTEQQEKEFLENIFRADINKYAVSDFIGYNGGPMPYEVELENGKTVIVHHEGGPHLTIGEKTYKCYSEDVLDALDELEKEIYKENYPDEYDK